MEIPFCGEHKRSYNTLNDCLPLILASTIQSSISLSISAMRGLHSGCRFTEILPFSFLRTPVRRRVLRIIDTSWPVPVRPRFGSSSLLKSAATILFRLFLAIEVASFLFSASLLITGVLE